MLLQGSRCDWGPCCYVGPKVDRVSAGSSGELRDLYESPINRVQLSGASRLLIVSYEIQARVIVSPAPELSNDLAEFSAPQLCPCASFMVASAGASGAGSAQIKEGPGRLK